MHREVILACLPYAGALILLVGGLRGLLFLGGARLQLRRLAGLHMDQAGAVQSLSFALTLPLFLMVLLLLVQVTQLTIGCMLVEYAAFAAARAAVVWIPASLGVGPEQENRISRYRRVGELRDADGYRYSEYDVEPGSVKFRKIHFAAALACMPVSPSREVGLPRRHPGNAAAGSLVATYAAIDPRAHQNPRVARRLINKLAYALEFTHLRILIRHKHDEPDLRQYGQGPYPEEYAGNEVGWQDQIAITVTHEFALLPGVGRLFGRQPAASRPSRPPTGQPEHDPPQEGDGSYPRSMRLASAVRARPATGGGSRAAVFAYPLSATVRLNNEGEKPVLTYVQRSYSGDIGKAPRIPPQAHEPEFDL